jgi:hypothetical protein
VRFLGIVLVFVLVLISGGADLSRGRLPTTNLVIHLNNKDTVNVRRTSLEQSKNGSTWRGEIDGTGEPVLLMQWLDGRFSGMFAYRGRLYTVQRLTSSDGQVHAVVAAHPERLPPQHAETHTEATDLRAQDSAGVARSVAALMIPPHYSPSLGGGDLGSSPISLAKRQALAAKDVTIDVMLLYTSTVKSKYVNIETDLIERSIAEANQSFINSAIRNVKLRLVHSEELAYDETAGSHFDHLYRMVDGAGPFAKVSTLRNEWHADVVVLIVDDGSACGLATRVAADAEEAFAVVHHACAALTYSVPHEIGHILGARHEMAGDESVSPFPYGHGYVNGTKWRDIMSYNASCNGCPRLPFWSNPTIKINGEPGGDRQADNARVILEQAQRVANFR